MAHEKLCLGGDFAGLLVKFAPLDGSLVEIPVYLIPEALLEWGQAPSALELLSSEEWDAAQLQRQEITVLPATGCGVDNLDTMKSDTNLKNVDWSQPSESTLILDSTTSTNNRDDTTTQRLETQFSLPNAHRVRVSLDLKKKTVQQKDEAAVSYEIQSPILLNLERQTSTTSSYGTRADGGGLDGRTVSQLIGDRLRKSHSFAEEKFNPGAWKADAEQQLLTPSTLIHLPGNLTIASGPAETDGTWLLQMSHFTADNEEDSLTIGSSRMIQRKFDGLQCEATYNEEVGEYMV